jgi:outer membrane immunogenic protein
VTSAPVCPPGLSWIPGAQQCLTAEPALPSFSDLFFGRRPRSAEPTLPPAAPPDPNLVGRLDPLLAWSGVYLGINAGSSFGQSETFNLHGGSIGVQAGFGQVFGPNFYVGIEGGLNHAAISGTKTGRVTQTLTYDATASLLGRVGFVYDRMLLYGVGGAQYTHVELARTGPKFDKVDDQWQLVPVLGAGVDIRVAPNVTGGVRYTSEWQPSGTFFRMRDVDAIRTDSIKAHLNYYPYSSSEAPDTRPFSWSGFYIGLNAGGTGGKNEFLAPQGGSFGGQFGYGFSSGAGAYVGLEATLQYGDVIGKKTQFGVTEQQSELGTASILARFGCCDFRNSSAPLVYAAGGRTWTRSEYAIEGMGFHDVDTRLISGWTGGIGAEMPVGAGLSVGVQYLSTWYEAAEYFDGGVKPGPTRTDYMSVRLNWRPPPPPP